MVRPTQTPGWISWVVVVALLLASVAFWAHAEVGLSHAHQSLARSEESLHRARVELTLRHHQLSSTSTKNQRLAQSNTQMAAADAGVRQKAASAQLAATSQGANEGALTACVNGVLSAYSELQAASAQGAVNALTGASAPCVTADGGGGDGLVYPFDFADPSVINAGGTFYAYATNSVAGTIQVMDSTDRLHWTVLGNALAQLPTWASAGFTWAPSVIQLGASYVMYFSTVFGSSGDQCIGSALSPTPAGPYTVSADPPIACQTNIGGSTDPDAYIGFDGTPYLMWGSVGTTTHSTPPMLWANQLSPDGQSLLAGSTPTEMLAPSQSWEGGSHGVVEGPAMVAIDNSYILLYSGNDWRTANYAIGLAQCSGPLGPCSKPNDGPILASAGNVLGPGGPTVFADNSGQAWVAFHAWLPGAVGYPNSRVLYMRPLTFDNGQLVIAPS